MESEVKRQRSDGAQAGSLFNRLADLDAQEQEELAASPASIRAKFEERRARLLDAATETVRDLVLRMRA